MLKSAAKTHRFCGAFFNKFPQIKLRIFLFFVVFFVELNICDEIERFAVTLCADLPQCVRGIRRHFFSAVTAVCALGNGIVKGRILSFAAAGICAAAHKRCAYMPQPTRVSALKLRGIHMLSYAGIAAGEGAEEYVHTYVPRCRYERSGDGGGAPGKSCLMIFNTYVPRRTPPLFRALRCHMRAHTRACARMPACSRALINNNFFRAHNTVERKIYPPLCSRANGGKYACGVP